MSDNCRQRYRLATGEGLTPNPGSSTSNKYAKGGHVQGHHHGVKHAHHPGGHHRGVKHK